MQSQAPYCGICHLVCFIRNIFDWQGPTEEMVFSCSAWQAHNM